DAMAEIGAAGDGDDAALMQDRLAAEDREGPLEGEGGKLPARAFRLDPLQRRAADERPLGEGDAGAEPGFVGVVVRRDVRAPVEIALLHPERIDGAVAGIGNAEVLPRFPEAFIDMGAEFRGY